MKSNLLLALALFASLNVIGQSDTLSPINKQWELQLSNEKVSYTLGIGEKIKIKTKDKNIHKGKITSIDSNALVIKGETIPIENVKKVRYNPKKRKRRGIIFESSMPVSYILGVGLILYSIGPANSSSAIDISQGFGAVIFFYAPVGGIIGAHLLLNKTRFNMTNGAKVSTIKN